jgi:hypothetical protein
MDTKEYEEARRLAEALTVPMAGKYISTDDIKAGGAMITKLLETKTVKRPWINANPRNLLIGALTFVIFGFVAGKIYTWDSIVMDCKVLGMFRIANVPFHCKMMTP